MLDLVISEKEMYDADSNLFIKIPGGTLSLEHSLISLSKWESKWLKPYLSSEKKTLKEDRDYIRCMVVGGIKDERLIKYLSVDEQLIIQNYIQSPMTATVFSSKKTTKNNKKDVITAELLYARMASHGIPFTCEKWHLNRLLTLIKVCDLQNSPREKMSKKESTMWIAEQNAARRAKYNTRG